MHVFIQEIGRHYTLCWNAIEANGDCESFF